MAAEAGQPSPLLHLISQAGGFAMALCHHQFSHVQVDVYNGYKPLSWCMVVDLTIGHSYLLMTCCYIEYIDTALTLVLSSGRKRD